MQLEQVLCLLFFDIEIDAVGILDSPVGCGTFLLYFAIHTTW